MFLRFVADVVSLRSINTTNRKHTGILRLYGCRCFRFRVCLLLGVASFVFWLSDISRGSTVSRVCFHDLLF